MGKSAPDPPDYRGAAEAEGVASREMLEQQTWANRPTQISPWGRVDWSVTPTYDPVTDQDLNVWQQDVTLSPEQQAAVEAQQRIGAGRSALAESLLGRAGQEFGAPVGWDPLDPNAVGTGSEARRAAEDAVYQRATSRLDPQWEQARENTESQLWNQGLRPGDEAYDRAMGNFERARTDAYQTAINESIMAGGREAEREFGMDFQRRQQALAEVLQRRGWSLNEINAALSGQQVAMPNMPGFTASGRAQAPQYLDAARGQYGAAVDQFNAEQMGMQGLFSGVTGLATAAAPWFGFSDRRIKREVSFIGKTKGGLNVYGFTNKEGHWEVGVMADEAPEDVVVEGEVSGLKLVDYSRVK